MQAIAAAAALLGLASLARTAGSVLLIFLVSAVVALILNPSVTWLQRHRVPRGIAIAVVLATLWAGLAGMVAVLLRPVTEQVQAIQRDLPGLVDSANSSLANLQAWLDDRGLGVQVKRPGQTGLETLQDSLLSGSTDVLGFTRDLVTRSPRPASCLC
ncbi:AI-2E family transporter [Nocardioides gansuensis]|uniref:AI-2E family transporter n=1 Tax=Nocardioides gansuensis TaxID=2138300 RepID=UPI0014032E93|nr:AI-2E family transporter [Nocardioides gansuensis]